MSATELPPEPGHRRSAASSFGLPAAWWPVALGEDVTSQPRAFRLGNVVLAVYRDATNEVRAVDDRCPHRRMPLSMGWVTQEGYLQCPYHGWCFDGATGQCIAIPNLAPGERVSPSIRVSAFRTAETMLRRLGGHHRPLVPPEAGEPGDDVPRDTALTQFGTRLADGFVHVWTGDPDAAEAAPELETSRTTTTGDPLRGELEVRSPYEQVAEALLWNPGRALGLGLLLGSGEEMIDPHVESDDATVIATRERLTIGLPRASTFDPLFGRTTRARIATMATTGLTHVEAESARGSYSTNVVIGLTPTGDYRTIVRWHGTVHGPGGPMLPASNRALATARRLSGRAVTSVEHVADLVAGTVDPAVERLRTLRGR